LKKLEGGCQAPIGGFCTMDGDKLLMKGFISSLDGKEFLLYTEQESSKFPEKLGEKLAEKILLMVGRRFWIRSMPGHKVLVTRQIEQSVEFINKLSFNRFYPFVIPMIKTSSYNTTAFRYNI